jgi:UDP-2,3-diacylglucosamine hydrolase
MAKSDGKYRVVKAIIRHPLSNRLFKILHPDWGMGLANWVGQKSREKGQYKVEPLHEYLQAASQKLKQYSASIYIQGHTHKPQIQELPEGIYGNIGQWLFQATWLELRDGQLTQGSL